jgi:hypothetical protein
MIFIIPIILGAAALGTAAFGVVKGVGGISDMEEAKEIRETAQELHEQAIECLENEWEDTQELAKDYGQLQIKVKTLTIGRFIAFIERIGQRASTSKKFLKGLDGISIQPVKKYNTAALEAENFADGIKTAATGAKRSYEATKTIATSVGVASTGTSISGLSGAAATNATLAWLGGGSLAAGGGGMALGSVVLGGITASPIVAVAGFMATEQGEKALTEALEYIVKVNAEIAELDEARDFLKRVQRRIDELCDLVTDLDNRAILALNELESHPFDKNRDADKFQKVALLIKALAEIMKAPVLDSQGKLNPITDGIHEKYGTI